MTKTLQPKVSIHLPVYNGENYIETELDSLLGQTYKGFELIITDNCSTDSTGDICQRYAQQDSRIRYIRNTENIGLNANFDQGIELARGEYFKWASHDDFHAPGFLQACVDVLDSDPKVVLAQSLVQIVDDKGRNISIYDSNLAGSDSDDLVERFKPLIHIRHVCTELFGLFRLDAVKKTKLLAENYHACDRAMLAEIALLGKIVQIKEPLFFNREHKSRYVRLVKPSERSNYHGHASSMKTEIAQLLLYRDYKQAIEDHVDDPKDQARCRRILFSWWFVEWNSIRLVVELAAWKFPWLYDWAKWVSDRIVKPQHPTVITQHHSD